MEPPKKSGWNWWAFLFGPFWYFYKGMLGKGALLFLLSLTGFLAPFMWIYAGLKGNEDYYIRWKQVYKDDVAT